MQIKGNNQIIHRIYGACGNGSKSSIEELEDNYFVQNDSPSLFAKYMIDLYHKYKFKIIGGCCGTNSDHLSQIARNLALDIQSR